MNCKSCGVEMAHDWVNGYCVHCDWLLGEGYTQEEIHEMIKRAEPQ